MLRRSARSTRRAKKTNFSQGGVILNAILSPTRVAMMPYLPAIDGLRAIAVVLVLLFHAKLPLVRGGFIGVDVFFVISGYLITGLILQRHAEGRFLLLDFYDRRIRRISPALFLVLISTMAFG